MRETPSLRSLVLSARTADIVDAGICRGSRRFVQQDENSQSPSMGWLQWRNACVRSKCDVDASEQTSLA